MKFHCPTPEQKAEARLQKELAKVKRWTRHFLWLPKRFGEECRWLEFYWTRYPNAFIYKDAYWKVNSVWYRTKEISFKKPLDK